MQESMKEATEVYAQVVIIECPYCGSEQGGWGQGDPRGSSEFCSACGKRYKIADDATIYLP
jgi:DNA-directed RNA polymerase subunit RPC12/RpoP